MCAWSDTSPTDLESEGKKVGGVLTGGLRGQPVVAPVGRWKLPRSAGTFAARKNRRVELCGCFLPVSTAYTSPEARIRKGRSPEEGRCSGSPEEEITGWKNGSR